MSPKQDADLETRMSENEKLGFKYFNLPLSAHIGYWTETGCHLRFQKICCETKLEVKPFLMTALRNNISNLHV